MARKALWMMLVAFVLAALPVCAQPDGQMSGAPMGMESGMPGGMTCPMCRAMMGQTGGRGMTGAGMTMPGQILMHARMLDLTKEQTGRIRSMHTELRKEQIRLTSQIQIAQIDLQELLAQDTVDMPKVERQVREISRLQGDLQLARIRTMNSVRNVLTPEQREKLQSLMMGTRPMGLMQGPKPMGRDATPPPGPGPPRP